MVRAENRAPATAFGPWLLLVDEGPVFELSLWCGTCPFLFQRVAGVGTRLELPALSDRLTAGLDTIDDEVVGTDGSLLPEGEVLPLLLEIRPRLQRPVEPGDDFAEDQVATWGIDPAWGPPQNPDTAYDRTHEMVIDAEAHLYAHIVPMVPPTTAPTGTTTGG